MIKIINSLEELTLLSSGVKMIAPSLSDDDYHQTKGYSSSQIKDAMQSLMYFDQKHNKKVIEIPTTDHFCIGKLVHCMILEPEHVNNRFVTKPDVPKATIKQRATYNKWVNNGKPNKSVYKEYPTEITIERCEFWDNFSRRDRTLVSPEQWQQSKNMANAVCSNPIVKRLLTDPNVEREHSYFCLDEETQLLVKARPDIKVNNTIADIKSIGLREPVDEDFLINKLRYEIKRRKYHVSAAMYLDITGADNFFFIFVNKEINYHWVAVIQIGEELLNEGYELYRQTLNRIKNAEKTQEWPDPSSTRLCYDTDAMHYVVPII